MEREQRPNRDTAEEKAVSGEKMACKIRRFVV